MLNFGSQQEATFQKQIRRGVHIAKHCLLLYKTRHEIRQQWTRGITKGEVISKIVPEARMTLSWIQACRDFEFSGLSSASLPSGSESTSSRLTNVFQVSHDGPDEDRDATDFEPYDCGETWQDAE